MKFLRRLFVAAIEALLRRAARKRVRISTPPMPDERSSIEQFKRIVR